ncbi:MAG: hypothetical protein AVDCRST_MAG79-72 [uncultured Thermoleophilia bacterium]|uniref:Uncharacterized protein n=1 Tax=uncultured Thermoleophilia bacterium TaxID=1497501 RepID=A0A6J4TBR9_9ACTN|nr:MAG: hypothetical protein AVDCRST_MAG79-72 [uncultured Thermoleophilia bacterium]
MGDRVRGDLGDPGQRWSFRPKVGALRWTCQPPGPTGGTASVAGP